jgi:lipopolysaccharide transport system permease protein
VFYCVFFGIPNAGLVQLPLLLLPLIFISLGTSWILASLGVFLRDIGQIIGVGMSVLMFLTPIFYPIAALPKEYQDILCLNPLTFIVDQARGLMIFNQGMDWVKLMQFVMISLLYSFLGFAWFQKTRKGFADVI